MGRYRSSDSGSDYSSSKKSKRRKKERRRGRSRSSSPSDSSRYSSSRHSKKSKKKHRSSPSPTDRRGYSDRSRRSRSRSRSVDRYGSRSRRRSGSRSYERKPSRRSRSPDVVRRRSRSPDAVRRRSRSYSRDRRSRSGSRGRVSRGHRRSRSRSRSSERTRSSREASHSSVSQGLTSLKTLSMDDQRESHRLMTMAEQAEERMRQALKAAAAADEKLRVESLRSEKRMDSPELRNSQKFADSVASIEADNFVPSSFKSSRNVKIKEEPSDFRSAHDDAIFGSLSVSGFVLKPDPDNRPIDFDTDSIMHPSLFCDTEEKLDCWIERLSQLRKRKLEGEAMQ